MLSEHKLELIIIDNELIFFEKEKKLYPTLRLLHKCKKTIYINY